MLAELTYELVWVQDDQTATLPGNHLFPGHLWWGFAVASSFSGTCNSAAFGFSYCDKVLSLSYQSTNRPVWLCLCSKTGNQR